MSDDANTVQQQLDDVRTALRQARQLIGATMPAEPPNVEAHGPAMEI